MHCESPRLFLHRLRNGEVSDGQRLLNENEIESDAAVFIELELEFWKGILIVDSVSFLLFVERLTLVGNVQ